MKKICVLMGGTSNERDVSLVSGGNVAEALRALGTYDVVPVRLDADSLDALPAGADACYIALHGGWGENGGVQAALDARGIPYTGPGAAASRLAMDKIASKKVFDAAGVPTAAWAVATPSRPLADSPVDYPCVVKAPRDGSSVGVYLVRRAEDFAHAVAEAQRIDREKFGGEGEALVEAFIPGRETTVGVIGHEALPVVEICAPGGWYGYEEKYNSDETRYPFPDDAFCPARGARRVRRGRLPRRDARRLPRDARGPDVRARAQHLARHDRPLARPQGRREDRPRIPAALRPHPEDGSP